VKIDPQSIKVIKNIELIEEGRRISKREAYFILTSVAIGIGYISTSAYYYNSPNYFFVPISTCIINIVFGLISVKMLLDAKSVQEERVGSSTSSSLGSLQELAYYFSGDRSFIMIVGLQYGINCIILSAFCLNHTVMFVVD
jgi:magnesium-transporting ATPase (P-type)